MKIILSKQCESFTGSLGKGYGYHIQHRKNGFFGKRNTKGDVPPDGHWRFIVACAVLAQAEWGIVDIEVSNREFYDALNEAGFFCVPLEGLPELMDAKTVLEYKFTLGL